MSADIPRWAAKLVAAREGQGWDIPEAGERLWVALGKSTQKDSARRMVDNWERGRHRPRGKNLLIYCRLLGINPHDLDEDNDRKVALSETPNEAEILASLAADAMDLANWAERTNVGDATLDYLSDTVRRLAVDYQRRPPLPVLQETAEHYRRVSGLIRGHQHLRQTRDLYVITGQLLALLSWISSDLGQPAAAEAYSRSGWVMAEQADHDGLRALILVTRSKTAYWERRLHQAAEFAAHGIELAPATSLRVLLACQLGDAWQGIGDIGRAEDAHVTAQRAREAIAGPDEIGGVWSCGVARQANYAIGVSLRAGDPAAALAHADTAHEAYAYGEPCAYGTWAQINIGTGIAHILGGDLDAAAAALAPILELPPEQRLATLSARLGEVDWRLANRRFTGSRQALTIREQITDYRADAIATRALTTGEA